MSIRVGASEKLSVAPGINWTILSLGLVLLAILLRLGFWQLERAADKQQLLAHIAAQQAQAPLALGSLHGRGIDADATATEPVLDPSLTYRRVSVSGHFNPLRYWLLDNQVEQGVVGYHVIGLLESDAGIRLLVNRGWVAAPMYREQLPAVEFPAGLQTLTGRLVIPAHNRLLNTTARDPATAGWPLRIQELDLHDAEQQLGLPLFPAVLQLATDDPAALVMEWRDVNVSVSKHQGYALQWFAMAAALVVALVCANSNLGQRFSAARRESSNQNNDNKNNANNNHDRDTGRGS